MRNLKLVVAAVALLVVAMPGTGNAQVGVGVMWQESGIVPDMVLPLKLGDGMVIEPMLGSRSTQHLSTSGQKYKRVGQSRLGLGIELQSSQGGVSPVFGGQAMLVLNAESYENENIDSEAWVDLLFGVYFGGSAEVSDQVDLVIGWGPSVQFNGEEPGDEDSALNWGSRAFFKVRMWVFE